MESVVTFLQDVVPQVSMREHGNGHFTFGSGSSGNLVSYTWLRVRSFGILVLAC